MKQSKKARRMIVEEIIEISDDEEVEPIATFKDPSPQKGTDKITQLWSQKYKPSLADLAVHKKKTSHVRDWLSAAMQCKRPQILILIGPSGSGKTACLEALAKDMTIEMVEWENPIHAQRFGDQDYVSVGSYFSAFVQGASRRAGLSFSNVKKGSYG
jgi:SpoVK/Ycf46/Vps4 family AAA+-type ATPase